eukprot:gnl/MRDRNA2_/MRDRNA2_102065_c0_seq1.p1 gnl/MRDRNA2_/MRDRNA2_102065_c0~~gnl/MRDRNA2_/MRDRNA2_102065_c0_seq1.p1  ORF type:complete len:374 (-),score=71.48 gnl/MRDRNA2_/MRDRNA2_102065_c0_seq1:20-1141(-)
MFRSGLEEKCPGLKLPCVPHIGEFNGGQEYKLATNLAAVRFMREPHDKVPPDGFNLIMRRDHVQDVETYIMLHDMQNLRDWLYSKGKPYIVNLLFHPWLFPDLPYRGEASTNIETAIFCSEGVFPVNEPGGAGKVLKKQEQKVWVKDKVYMCMGPDVTKIRVDRHRLLCTFWSLCIPEGGERAIVTKHILINETQTHICKEILSSCAQLIEVSVPSILQHLQKLLTAVQAATKRLSLLMARCESAFEGVALDDQTQKARFLEGSTDPFQVWEEQLALLDRTVNDSHSQDKRPAPLLSEMLRRKVYEEIGRQQKGKCSPDDQEVVELGEKAFLESSSCRDRAQAIHKVLIACIHDLETLAEGNAEMLSVEGVTA